MSLMNEPETPVDGPQPSGSSRYVLLGLLMLVIAAAATWALWPAPAPKRQATVIEQPKPVEPAPAVKPAEPAPAETAVAPAPRTRKGKAKAEPAAKPPPPPALPTGTLQVESDVAGASVFIDREFRGAAPVTIEGVAPGSHQLNVSAEGFQGHAETIEVSPGPAAIMVRFKEVTLNETVSVVHRHTMGSCQGRLVADTQGLRYETSNKDDAFVMKHAEVEVFEVDYLKKNLRIKRRGGKTYNFTNESADALFVFHKNVQAARARLAKGDAPAR
jgi:hypothetical protein